MSLYTEKIIQTADKIVCECGTRDARRIARDLGVIVMPRPFQKQKGVYLVVERNRFVFIKEDLHHALYNIVLLHEIGHDRLHRAEAIRSGGFQEFNLFDRQAGHMEYEANLFTSQISLADDKILEYIHIGYDIYQIAQAMDSDSNLVAMKIDTLISQGHRLRHMEHRNNFLKYD